MKVIYINKEFDASPIMEKIVDIDKRLMEIEDKIWAIEKLKQEQLKVGFKADEIFIPSKAEYEKYKGVIPLINNYWWLRTIGIRENCVTCVYSDGSILSFEGISSSTVCVRPMIHLPSGTTEINAPIGARINLYNFPWIAIDKHLAIAEVPIGFEKFDDKSNDYEGSHIRKYINDWLEKRKKT